MVKNALNSAPKVCSCGRRLSKPVCSPTDAYPYYNHEPKWHIECLCGIVWLWSFPNVYKKSHILPLGRAVLSIREV